MALQINEEKLLEAVYINVINLFLTKNFLILF